ncbi:MAG: hypothetical protein RIC12_00240 [Pirellulales bacterium]
MTSLVPVEYTKREDVHPCHPLSSSDDMIPDSLSLEYFTSAWPDLSKRVREALLTLIELDLARNNRPV